MEQSKNIIKVLFDARFEELSYLTEEDKKYIVENEVDIDSIFSDIDEKTRERIKELIERVNEKNTTQNEYFYYKFYKAGFNDRAKIEKC